ncbi:MAG: bifunctional metallophosphatase/5'-nucleotidase [Cytophagales bacterium]|nr:MAG: bifunctional metallophosphatase/5'-nucleotidase [Cytophagales bacterium]
MNRRDFMQNTILTAGGLLISSQIPLLASNKKEIKLTILHTNDTHSRIDPFPNDGRKTSGLGGMSRRATLIKKIRKEEKNVLLFDSGDIFQGTPYFNYFGGELEYKLMSQMGYDASTLGNHDFDNGLNGLRKMLPNANFPMLISNYDFKNNDFKNTFQPYKIFEKEGLKIGVFGIGIEFEGLVPENLHEKTLYIDPVEKSKEMVKELTTKKCDLIICLSHLGYKYEENKISDTLLAQKVSGIDIILGAHTHTFLDKPVVIKNNEGFQTMVAQVGWAGIKLGRIDLTFSKDKSEKRYEGMSIEIS